MTRTLVLSLSVALVGLLTGCTDEFKASCLAQSGQVVKKTHIDFGNAPDGRIVIVPRTTRFCKVNGVITDIE